MIELEATGKVVVENVRDSVGERARSQQRRAIEELDRAGGRPGERADRRDRRRQSHGLPKKRSTSE